MCLWASVHQVINVLVVIPQFHDYNNVLNLPSRTFTDAHFKPFT